MSDLALLDVGKLDDATRSALRRLILTLADSKRLMGIRYSDWLRSAASLNPALANNCSCSSRVGITFPHVISSNPVCSGN